jgi:hypothetical protein
MLNVVLYEIYSKKSNVTNTYVHGLYMQSGYRSPKFKSCFYLCRRHGHHGVPDVMMSLKGAVGGPKKGQYEVLEKDSVRS